MISILMVRFFVPLNNLICGTVSDYPFRPVVDWYVRDVPVFFAAGPLQYSGHASGGADDHVYQGAVRRSAARQVGRI